MVQEGGIPGQRRDVVSDPVHRGWLSEGERAAVDQGEAVFVEYLSHAIACAKRALHPEELN